MYTGAKGPRRIGHDILFSDFATRENARAALGAALTGSAVGLILAAAYLGGSLAQAAPAVYEAAFRADGVLVSVDILEREGNRFCLTEVKSTTGKRTPWRVTLFENQ